jgi:hypothetical protein
MASFIEALIRATKFSVSVISRVSESLVQTLTLAVFPGHFLEVTLDGCGCSALSNRGWLFVVLALANLSQ